MNSIKFNLISNNVQGLQPYKKRLKIFKYLKSVIKVVPMAFCFCKKHIPQRKMKDWIRLIDDFNGQIHYSHGKSNSCGVLIAFFGSIIYTVKKRASDKHGRILIIALIEDTELILINLHNANTANDQLTTFSELINLLENFDFTKNKPIIFAGDFNLFLDRSLEAKGGNPCLKKQSLSKFLYIKEKLSLCGIWQI